MQTLPTNGASPIISSHPFLEFWGGPLWNSPLDTLDTRRKVELYVGIGNVTPGLRLTRLDAPFEENVDNKSRKNDSGTPSAIDPLTRDPISIRISRRQLLKASLIGAASAAATVGGLTRLERLAAAPSTVGHWRRLAPKSAPSPRSGAAIAYDGARGVPVLFSGSADSDTWTWNGRTWVHQNPR